MKDDYAINGLDRLRESVIRDSFNEFFTVNVILLVLYGIIFLFGLIGKKIDSYRFFRLCMDFK